MSDYLFGRFRDANMAAAWAYALFPNWQHFWACDALDNGGSIPWRYILNAAVYGAAYAAGVLSLGMVSFRHAELK